MSSSEIINTETGYDSSIGPLSTLRYARWLGIFFVVAAIVFGATSFLILLGLTSIEPSENVILAVLSINAIFVSLLIFLVGREVYSLVQARRRGRAAARMHIRIVGLFGIVAAFPAIIVAIIAGITLDLGLDRIFDSRTRTIVDNSISVAESYVKEATASLNTHTVNMGIFLNRNVSLYNLDRRGFVNLMTGQARARGLAGAFLVRADSSQMVAARVDGSERLFRAPSDLLESAQDGRPSCILPRTQNVASCVFKLQNFEPDAYFYVLDTVDATVLNSIQLMREITSEYEDLEEGRVPLQLAFASLYFGICLTILLSAIWMGIAVADRLVQPIRRLIGAADQISSGNLEVTVPNARSEGELKSLTDTFNSMTSELRTQRDEILDNQEQIDRRRRFTEAVLSGVTAGIIGVDGDDRLAIANLSASALLSQQEGELLGQTLAQASPELGAVLEHAKKTRKAVHREQITLIRKGRERTLNVQVSIEDGEEETHSSVITIDDITDLVSAQRTSAWADVARRIAHEIKNPLTPIQLSAERIRRRYGKVIVEDREVFDQCTDTIIRQVEDIGRMVDEFSSFARMPKPTMVVGNLAETMRESVFLLKVAHPEITFDVQLDTEECVAKFDNRLLGQAFGNLIKNATEAIEGFSFGETEKPSIEIGFSRQDEMHRVDIIDNGKGLPTENRQRLLEPYMTTREKGTGLGLAIVGKILEEHGGHIELLDAPSVGNGGHGAMISVFIPVHEPVNAEVSSRDASAEELEMSNGL